MAQGRGEDEGERQRFLCPARYGEGEKGEGLCKAKGRDIKLYDRRRMERSMYTCTVQYGKGREGGKKRGIVSKKGYSCSFFALASGPRKLRKAIAYSSRLLAQIKEAIFPIEKIHMLS